MRYVPKNRHTRVRAVYVLFQTFINLGPHPKKKKDTQ